MDYPVNERIIASFQKYSKGAAIALIVIGIATLVGWAFDITVLKSIRSDWTPMAANSALCFILSGAALLLLLQLSEIGKRKKLKSDASTPLTESNQAELNAPLSYKIVIYSCVLIITLIALLTLVEYLFSINLGINDLIFTSHFNNKNLLSSGRMAWITALNFLFNAVFLFFFNIKNTCVYRVLQGLVILAAGLSFLVFLSYLYYASNFLAPINNVNVAFDTSISFILLTSGILFANPERGIMTIVSSDTLGGKLIRKYFPTLIIILIVFSELRYLGEEFGFYNNEFGLAMMIIFSITIISFIFWRAANFLGEEDIKGRILEKERRASEQKFQTAFNLGSVPMAIQNLTDRKFTEVNEVSLKLLGFKRDEVIGRTPDELHLIDTTINEQLTKLLSEKGALHNIETELYKKSGEKINTIISSEVIELDDQKYNQSVIIDITEKKKAEDELKQKTNELSEMNKDLEQFVYIASHDLQEPLRTISNFVGLLDETFSEKADEDTKQYLQFILIATSRMQHQIKGLLDFTRDRKTIPFVSVDLNKILKEAITDLDITIKENNAKITHATLPVLVGCEEELKQLFLNLISNALKFRKKNVIPEIEITFEEKDIEYLFAIKDNGIGIEEKHFDKLFIIFQRLNITDQYEGTGIGLAICKKIINLHNGKIWVKSKLGEGCTFYFTISKLLKN